MGAGRKQLKSHRRRQRWADKGRGEEALCFAGSSHAKGIALEKMYDANSAIRKCARVHRGLRAKRWLLEFYRRKGKFLQSSSSMFTLRIATESNVCMLRDRKLRL